MTHANREIVLRFLAQPIDVNFGGKVHGGSVMKWLDQAGYVCATTWSGKYCVTAFVGDMNFHQPIHVGELIEVRAKIIHTGRTSMHILIELHTSSPMQGELLKALRCMMVFVAVDKDGHAIATPAWQPTSEEDIALENYAVTIMELRRTNQKALDQLST